MLDWIRLFYLPQGNLRPEIKISRILETSIAIIWARQDSNLRPGGYEPHALPLSYGPGWAKKIISRKPARHKRSRLPACFSSLHLIR